MLEEYQLELLRETRDFLRGFIRAKLFTPRDSEKLAAMEGNIDKVLTILEELRTGVEEARQALRVPVAPTSTAGVDSSKPDDCSWASR